MRDEDRWDYKLVIIGTFHQVMESDGDIVVRKYIMGLNDLLWRTMVFEMVSQTVLYNKTFKSTLKMVVPLYFC